MSIPFLAKYKKELAKLENVSTDFRPPSHWYTTGNLAVNKIMSGDYYRGIPQGRVSILAGPSGAGKSFLLGNIIKAAQDDGAFILALDSENALDTDWLQKIGVDVDPEKFLGISVVTIADVVSTVSDFIKMYEKEYGKYNYDAPKIIICLDSLDMLLTETEEAHFNAGVQKGDQGQRAKQMKAFLRTTVARIKTLNIAFIGTHQVYPADVLQGEGKWAINNAIRYSASQIILITKLKLKEGTEISGIRMYCETFKSRFAKLGSKVEVIVPYDTGMNPYSGLIDLLEADKVIVKSGAWLNCTFPGEKAFSFQSTKMDKALVERLLSHPFITQQAKQFEDKLREPETPEELGEADPVVTVNPEVSIVALPDETVTTESFEEIPGR
jgi:RecA/RadA recombinase